MTFEAVVVSGLVVCTHISDWGKTEVLWFCGFLAQLWMCWDGDALASRLAQSKIVAKVDAE